MLLDDRHALRAGPNLIRFYLRQIQRITANSWPAGPPEEGFDTEPPPKYTPSELRDFKRRGIKFNNE